MTIVGRAEARPSEIKHAVTPSEESCLGFDIGLLIWNRAMSGFFEEIKRRKVYRVAAAYAVVAGGAIQLASAVFPAWELPSWALRLVIILLLIGFPISLILAWALEVTPEGIRATHSTPATPRRRRNIVALVALGVIVSAAAGFFLLPRASARKLDKSIAVLPFENFSDDKENAYFADGIQDDVLTNLSKIGDLKVISRTSVMSFRGNARNVREIGKALGVSTILEGSVRKSQNRVRVNVQLINALNDEHIWSEVYDRDLTDVFAIQTDLAQKIANELRAKLSPTEKALISAKPTENSEAYLLAMQGQELFYRPDKFRDTTLKAEQVLEEATKLDPKFAAAFAGLGMVENWIYHSFDRTPARRDKAKAAIDTALRLNPNLPEAHLSLGFFYYYCDRDDGHYERALDEFGIAQRSFPNNSEVYLAIGAIERRQGKWAQSTEHMEKAAALDPRNAWVWQNLALNYQAVRQYEAAEKTFDRALEAAPRSFSVRGLKAKLALEWKGDFSVSEKMLAQAPPGVDPDNVVLLWRISLLTLQRRFSEALQLVQKLPEENLHGEGTGPTPKALLEGICFFFLGEKEKARADFERARVVIERSVSEVPDDAGRHAQLGVVLAGLGRKEDAIREGQRAIELLPESKDAFEGPQFTVGLAQIYTWTGEKEQALQLLEHSLSTPSGLTVALLKLDPVWDPLRQDSRFLALLQKHGG
jgi:TolB-like protein/Flp pilus assembly protein TadD